MGSGIHSSSLLMFLFYTFLSLFSVLAVAADEDASANPGDVNPVPPIQEVKTEDPIAGPLTDGCPQPCSVAGSDPANWTQIHSQEELSRCDQPVLFALNVENSFSEFATLYTCLASGTSTQTRRDQVSRVEARAAESSVSVANNCGAEKATVKTSSSFGQTGTLKSGSNVAAAAQLLAQYVDDSATCGTTIIFAKTGSSLVGLYVGAEVQKSSASGLIRERLQKGTQAFQVCDANDKRAETVGLFAVDTVSGLEDAQAAVKAWSNGKCIDIPSATKESIDLGVLSAGKVQARSIELRSRLFAADNTLARRADCKARQVVSGDSCASLAKKCGVTTANFNKYNPAKNFCSTLAPKQWVCCSAGTLPDKTPQPTKDGTCYIYRIKTGDGCYSLAQNFGITQQRIKDVNKNTWEWNGCDRLQLGQMICLSKGKPPMPRPISGAVCGPQKPGSKKPASTKTGWDLAGMNPCPLNACCSGYGFCGITAEFCTNTTAKGGAPGSSKANTPGCISNCGTKIVGNSKPPAKFFNIGYFQGYNLGRPCLNMDVGNLTALKTSYTHIHFAFAGLTSAFAVNLQPDVRAQFLKFKEVKGSWKKIISFGGWADSTDASTFQIYRDAIKPANRERFATNVMTVLKNHNLDGVDFDWEYPGSAASGDSATDTANYLAFLTLMRKKIGTSGKSMSVALPAAYWYLKPFPVAKIAPLVDYMVFMTYDLSGQWNYGNQYISGCPGGNCLRSHVNKTETLDSLAMITKAGVPPSKVIVGISSYGRSFKMASPSCTGPACKFTGSFSVSEAEPGVCTNSAGYLANAEIRQIIYDAKNKKAGVTAKSWYDSATDSDILTFGTKGKGMTDWVAYMSEATKAKRTTWAKGLNFGGVVEWAVDLEVWFSPKP
ncbi:Killer toxin subunits alpha beta [Fusarium albosuccineum]|uniref:chitinase n=1 Tax=Fusarium albosuccineum TaxID=1237068 RepID=A0A8H4PJ33_9HYPO|nr:Killer toxin subunits alpha beta [Fusarium albosuccineum]